MPALASVAPSCGSREWHLHDRGKKGKSRGQRAGENCPTQNEQDPATPTAMQNAMRSGRMYPLVVIHLGGTVHVRFTRRSDGFP